MGELGGAGLRGRHAAIQAVEAVSALRGGQYDDIGSGGEGPFLGGASAEAAARRSLLRAPSGGALGAEARLLR